VLCYYVGALNNGKVGAGMVTLGGAKQFVYFGAVWSTTTEEAIETAANRLNGARGTVVRQLTLTLLLGETNCV
jgi:hypothetical protein